MTPKSALKLHAIKSYKAWKQLSLNKPAVFFDHNFFVSNRFFFK